MRITASGYIDENGNVVVTSSHVEPYAHTPKEEMHFLCDWCKQNIGNFFEGITYLCDDCAQLARQLETMRDKYKG